MSTKTPVCADAASQSPVTTEAQDQLPLVANDAGAEGVLSPPPLSRSPAHSFRPGDWVVIFRIAVFGRPLIEGIAQIVATAPNQPDHYYVRFKGDPRPRFRCALPGRYQTAPDAILDELLAGWRVTMPSEILVEFFPDDLVPDNDNGEV